MRERMAEIRYNVEVSPAAYRDLEHQFLWLLDNRGRAHTDQLDREVSACLNSLEYMPERWQRLEPPRQHLRKAVIMHRYLLFFTVDNTERRVRVIAFRGAAEDWTNQPLPTD